MLIRDFILKKQYSTLLDLLVFLWHLLESGGLWLPSSGCRRHWIKLSGKDLPVLQSFLWMWSFTIITANFRNKEQSVEDTQISNRLKSRLLYQAFTPYRDWWVASRFVRECTTCRRSAYNAVSLAEWHFLWRTWLQKADPISHKTATLVTWLNKVNGRRANWEYAPRSTATWVDGADWWPADSLQIAGLYGQFFAESPNTRRRNDWRLFLFGNPEFPERGIRFGRCGNFKKRWGGDITPCNLWVSRCSEAIDKRFYDLREGKAKGISYSCAFEKL